MSGGEAEGSSGFAKSRTPNIIGAWILFEEYRRDLQKKISELELTSLNLTYSLKSEADFRQRLKDARSLFDKIEALIGPPREGTATHVS